MQRILVLTVLLCALPWNVASRSDRSVHMRLPRLQAENLWQLFVDRNAALQMEFLPSSETESVLLSVYQQLPLLKLLELRISLNRIAFTHRTTSGVERTFMLNAPLHDGEWHKLIIIVSGDELQIVENCHQLLKKAVYDIAFPSVANVRAHIGEDNNLENRFDGKMREFSADSGNPVHMKCPNLQIMMDNPIDTMLQTTVAFTENDVDNDEPESTTEQSLGENILEERNRHQMEERLQYLEDQFKHWKTLVQNLDGRVKKVELHQRGCQISGRIISFGEKQQDALNCTECTCSSTGEIHCGMIGCPHLKCAHPIRTFGECCPKCGEQCYYNGQYYEHGDSFWPKSCVQCTCTNGKMACQFRKAESCPLLECKEQETPQNQCCPVCVNIDHCNQNPCDQNAICENGPFKAKCTCKQGFFGNGTVCYDIDECLWDESTRQQLGGCLMGTMCINLPGSFKCDCLPGFQRLDERNCLDTIRI